MCTQSLTCRLLSVVKTEENQVQPEKDCEEKAGALVGEVQKSLPSISGTLSHCTFNFNFS